MILFSSGKNSSRLLVVVDMDDTNGSSHWCHMCSQMVNPVTELEAVKCPICRSGFIEEMSSAASENPSDVGPGSDRDSDRAFSLWAPVLLGMINSPGRRHRLRRMDFDSDDDDDEFDHEIESMIRRRRRSSGTILRLLQDLRAGMQSEPGNSETRESDRDQENERTGERMIVINANNQTIIVQGSYDSPNRAPMSSLSDYFMGPGLDLLLQHLAENDPNRYGTPPAQKEAVEALPTVKIEETVQCSVCLDECEVGCEVKEMPCGHKFHDGCILPWLELHSSCPVCRHQLPSDESKIGNRSNNNSNENESRDERNEGGRRIPWPFSSLFSGSRSSDGSSSGTTHSGSSRDATRGTSDEDQN